MRPEVSPAEEIQRRCRPKIARTGRWSEDTESGIRIVKAVPVVTRMAHDSSAWQSTAQNSNGIEFAVSRLSAGMK